VKHKVIENFFDEDYFNILVALFTGKTNEEKIPWYFNSSVASYNDDDGKNNLFYMTHVFYDLNVPRSPHYEKLFPLLQELGIADWGLIRLKANLYPNTERLHEHPMHTDFPFSHSAAILSLNTCDGYTKLKDGTKIDSIANRVLLFDASEKHCSTTTTNIPARMNININYMQGQFS
jgi:hypothetical protein